MPTTETEITFYSGGIRLVGTLECVAHAKPQASILLLSGSGPQDRDETIADKLPFRRLSKALANQGFAVFRWDDRGVGASDGDYSTTCASELVEDVGSAMQRLAVDKGFEHHVLLGHSQGALIAAKAARRFAEQVQGIGLLAGSGLPGRETLIDQHRMICRAEGMTDADIESSTILKARLFDTLLSVVPRPDCELLSDEQQAELRQALYRVLVPEGASQALSSEEKEQINQVVSELMEWEWRFLVTSDPADDLANVQCPVFAMTGDMDVQVDAKANIKAIEAACLAGNAESVEAIVLPGHNHLFQHSASRSMDGYYNSGHPFTAQSVSLIVAWLTRLFPTVYSI